MIVELFTAGHGEAPIMIDRSEPISGDVLDGQQLRKDSQFQSEDRRICAQWLDFHDPESGINKLVQIFYPWIIYNLVESGTFQKTVFVKMWPCVVHY